ncbi:MAG: TonB family protein, partial [candidate division KSB1 bacterium]
KIPINKNGKVLSTELEKSSGVFAFDQAALRAVQGANPLPALPEGSNLETLGVHFDFVANW